MAPSKSQGPHSPSRGKTPGTRKRHSRTKPRPIIFEDSDELPADYALRPFDDEEYPGMPLPTSGTLSSVGDSDDLPVVESGLSVEPEDLGRQFLRNATEQDNFESEFEAIAVDPGSLVLGQVVSEATLEASGHDRYELPSSSAMVGQHGEPGQEPNSEEVNVSSSSVREASLFDQPTDAGGTREPALRTDDLPRDVTPRGFSQDPERRAEFARTRETLQRGRELAAQCHPPYPRLDVAERKPSGSVERTHRR